MEAAPYCGGLLARRMGAFFLGLALTEWAVGLCHVNSTTHAWRAEARDASCHSNGILPLCSGFGSEDPKGGSRDEVALKVEGVVDRTMHVEEALGGSSRFEPLHLALSSPYRLVRVLGPILQIPALSAPLWPRSSAFAREVLACWRCSRRLQLVGAERGAVFRR